MHALDVSTAMKIMRNPTLTKLSYDLNFYYEFLCVCYLRNQRLMVYNKEYFLYSLKMFEGFLHSTPALARWHPGWETLF